MSYREKIDRSKEKVYSHAIATKIRDLMAHLRKSANESRKRRWVWELLQNSIDVAYPYQKVNVELTFINKNQEGELTFKHNGQPFSVDNITFLIEQVSTKDQGSKTEEGPIGKFGTGFLTTHLLSEIVEVTGIIKEPELPYKSFTFQLDRSHREIGDIINAVNDSIALLDNLDDQPIVDGFKEGNLNTTFRYKLNPSGIKVAEIGIADFHSSIPYVLLFSTKLQEVNVPSSLASYKVETQSVLSDEILLVTIGMDSLFDTEKRSFVVAKGAKTSVAVEVEIEESTLKVLPLDKNLPRLFCDFLLVGSEDLNIPFIVNCRYFSPTEPRDGVDLSDNDDIDIENNKGYIQESVSLFKKIVDLAALLGWLDLHNLANVKSPLSKDWLSTTWFKKHVVNPIRESLSSSNLVLTAKDEWQSIYDSEGNANIYFPYSSNEKIRKLIWELVKDWKPEVLPHETVFNDWYHIIWEACPRLDLKTLTEWIQAETALSELQSTLKRPTNAKDFLNRYLAILQLDEKFLNEVINDTYVVIPDQNGVFKTRSQLFIDSNREIDEELKNALQLLKVDVRAELLDTEIFTGEKIKYSPKGLADIVALLNSSIRDMNDVAGACNLLTSIINDDPEFPKNREAFYIICRTAFGPIIPERRKIKKWTSNIWDESDKHEVKWIADSISQTQTLDGLVSKLNFSSQDQATTWLNTIIEYFTANDFESKLNLKTSPILPNQNGLFTVKDDLFLDDGEIDEDLKSIAKILGRDFRNEMLDKRIYLELPDSRTYNNSVIATHIIEEVSTRLSEVKRSDSTKEGFSKLFLWFKNNADLANSLFSDLYVSKHKLYDDDEIAASLSNTEKLGKLMGDYGIEGIDDLRSILEGAMEHGHRFTPTPTPITRETLASLGISSLDEFVAALEDKNFARDFTHTSLPTLDMFNYVQSLISRTIENVRKVLDDKEDYDCRFAELVAPTVIGGITKKGLPIYIVVRPSDNGIVIVYYSSEKDILEQPDAELWIDNGVDIPKHLTLGEILKRTGINKIPLT